MKRTWGEYEKASTTTWGTSWYYMRIKQDAVNYESKIKQTPTHVWHKTKTWSINHSNCNI